MTRLRVLGLIVVLALFAASCGDDDDTTGTTEPAPLTTTTVATTTTAAAATTTTAAATTTTVATVDIVQIATDYAASIPEGWMAISDTEAFKEAVDTSGALLIDVREVSEYEEGHIPNAINIPLRTVTENLDKIPTDRSVFIYCKSGYRAGLTASSLRMLGYDNVLVYPPGWNGWTAANETVSTEAVTAETHTVPDIPAELYSAVNGFMTGIPEGYYTAGNTEAVQAAFDAGAFPLDIRTPGEYADGFIPGALNATLRELPTFIDQLPTDTQIIEYCKSGYRAALALPVLHVLGFDNARAYTGSWLAWTDAGLPTETP